MLSTLFAKNDTAASNGGGCVVLFGKLQFTVPSRYANVEAGALDAPYII